MKKKLCSCNCGCGGVLYTEGNVAPILYFTNNILQDSNKSVRVRFVSLDGFINDEWSASPKMLEIARNFMQGELNE